MSKIGQVVNGVITGVKAYGAFVRTSEGETGMIHISEISDYFVKDVGKYFKKGEKVAVKVIDIDNQGMLKLSLKAIQSNRKYAIPTKREISELNKIGFESLKQQMPIWIEEALKEGRNHEI